MLSGLLKIPHGIAVDNAGNIYIADISTNRILKIDNKGIFSTFVEATADTT